MTVKDLKQELDKYDDGLIVCRHNHVGFPVECLEVKLCKANYLDRFYEKSRCINDAQFVCIE